jgi:hypothetical protein
MEIDLQQTNARNAILEGFLNLRPIQVLGLFATPTVTGWTSLPWRVWLHPSGSGFYGCGARSLLDAGHAAKPHIKDNRRLTPARRFP